MSATSVWGLFSAPRRIQRAHITQVNQHGQLSIPVFYKLLSQAELRRVRFHDLRHTFASLLIQDNQSLAYVKDQLGHSSIKITVDTYGHLIPGANRQAVYRLDDASAVR